MQRTENAIQKNYLNKINDADGLEKLNFFEKVLEIPQKNI